jgi:hypothetical protein
MKYVHTAAEKDIAELSESHNGDFIEPVYDQAIHRVDGYILQGPVSDREAIGGLMTPEELQKSIKAAEKLSPQTLVPLEFLPEDMAQDSAVRASRWLSLAAYGWVAPPYLSPAGFLTDIISAATMIISLQTYQTSS